MNTFYLKLAGAAALLIGFLFYRHSLIAEGEQIKIDADNRVVAAQTIHNAEVETRAKTLSEQSIKTLKDSLAKAPAADAPHVMCSVRNAPRSSGSMPQAAGNRPDTSSTAEQPTVVSGVHEVDIGPDIDKRFADADALIKALQERVTADAEVCR